MRVARWIVAALGTPALPGATPCASIREAIDAATPIPVARLWARLPLVLLLVGAGACARQPAAPAAGLGADAVMTREEFRARVGVASITPDLLPTAFDRLPIGSYKDFHALGSTHLEHPARRLAGALGPAGRYIPVIQYKSIHDTPETRELLRAAAAGGQFPMPAGVTVEELLRLLERSGLESWLVERTKDGSLPRGTLFFLGNEPGYRPNYDPRTPAQIVEDARIVRDIFERNALGHRLALGGASTSDNAYNRRAYGAAPLEFFEGVLAEAGRRDVSFDAFVIHPYPYSGMQDASDFGEGLDAAALVRDSVEQIRGFRLLMSRHGQRDRPLLVGEVGLPIPVGDGAPALTGDYLDRMLTWSLTATDPDLGQPSDGDRLVQHFTWFILALPDGSLTGPLANPGFDVDDTLLLEPDGTLTALGRTLNAVADRLAPVR